EAAATEGASGGAVSRLLHEAAFQPVETGARDGAHDAHSTSAPLRRISLRRLPEPKLVPGFRGAQRGLCSDLSMTVCVNVLRGLAGLPGTGKGRYPWLTALSLPFRKDPAAP